MSDKTKAVERAVGRSPFLQRLKAQAEGKDIKPAKRKRRKK